MFYEIIVESHIRVPPNLFNKPTEEAVLECLNKEVEGYINKKIGVVIGVGEIISIGDGIIIPGDGAAYYDTKFKLYVYKPEIQEVIFGKVIDITDFGAFIDIGAIDGMIHISQTMDDYVSFSKSNVLSGKESKRTLKVNDKCKARIIAVSYKEVTTPKIGLTMRQPGLGSLVWLEQEAKKKGKEAKKAAKETKK